jgi:hypothetical protein
MKISIRLTEPFWRIVGRRDVVLVMQEPADISDLLAALCERYPALESEIAVSPPIIFIGDREAGKKDMLAHQDRVHLVWAVAGGSKKDPPSKRPAA